ncbi:unnamed protein product, partial [Phaeothamnion confervicola]
MRQVLSGLYLQVFGVPLTVPAVIAYSAVAVLALWPALGQGSSDAETDRSTRSWILGVTTAMATFSVYLMSLLALRIGAGCPWCFTSALLSWTMCTVAWAKQAVPQRSVNLVF